MVDLGSPWRRLRRANVEAMGHPWLFWPSVLFLGLLGAGPADWASPWLWGLTLLVVGPGLSLMIRVRRGVRHGVR